MIVPGTPDWAKEDPYLPRIATRYRGERVQLSEGRDAASELLRNDYAFLGEHMERAWGKRFMVRGEARPELGFLHLRESNPPAAPGRRVTPGPFDVHLSECYLAPPVDLDDSETSHVVSGCDVYRMYGVPGSLRTSAYVVPHTFFSGYCSQASCQMVLLNLMNQAAGVNPVCLGAFDITRIAFRSVKGGSLGGFDPGGLSPLQMKDVLASPWARVNGIYEFASGAERGLIWGFLAGYITSDCPVILCVDTTRWLEVVEDQLDQDDYKKLLRNLKPPKGPRKQTLHAVVIVGVTGSDSPEQRAFIVQDPLTAPFLKIRLADVVDAGMAAWEDGKVRWVAGVPKAVRKGVRAVHDLIMEEPASDGDGRFNYRLYATKDVVQKYVLKQIWPKLPGEAAIDLNATLSRWHGGYLWVVDTPPAASFVNASAEGEAEIIGRYDGRTLTAWRTPANSDSWRVLDR